ncbi:MAG: hypothetical protein R6U39_08320 [Candidatus Aegiribacteria sp.]
MIFLLAALTAAAPASGTDSVWTESGEGYSITVSCPAAVLEIEAVAEELQRYACGQTAEFRENFREYYSDSFNNVDWNMEINFTHEPSPSGMVCVTAGTWEYSGGAHGNSWTRTFVYDLETDSFPGPVELLGGEEEFRAFAGVVMERLNGMLDHDGWIEEGASASVENYHSLLPVPDETGGIAGYRVMFPPYQVAAYVYGPVEVFVSCSELSR